MRLFLKFLLLLLPLQLSAQTRIVFTPQWTAQSQFAGYYVALEKGFYKSAGLDVEIVHPSVSSPAVNRIKDGSSNIVTMQLLNAMSEVSNGLELVNLMQTSQHSGLQIISKDKNIRTFAGLRGKRVGIWKAGYGELAKMPDFDLNLGIEWVPFIQNINLFISGAIDATLAMSYSEALKIKAAGFDDVSVIPFAGTVYDFPDDGLYTTRSYYEKNKKSVDAFLEASRRGWEWARKNVDETVSIVLKYTRKENIATNYIMQKWMLEEILELQCPCGGDTPTFKLDRRDFERLDSLALEKGIIHRSVRYEEMKGGSR